MYPASAASSRAICHTYRYTTFHVLLSARETSCGGVTQASNPPLLDRCSCSRALVLLAQTPCHRLCALWPPSLHYVPFQTYGGGYGENVESPGPKLMHRAFERSSSMVGFRSGSRRISSMGRSRTSRRYNIVKSNRTQIIPHPSII
jgi:hypothetical protein